MSPRTRFEAKTYAGLVASFYRTSPAAAAAFVDALHGNAKAVLNDQPDSPRGHAMQHVADTAEEALTALTTQPREVTS